MIYALQCIFPRCSGKRVFPCRRRRLSTAGRLRSSRRADKLFDEKPDRTSPTALAALLSTRISNGDALEAWRLFAWIRSRDLPCTSYTFTPILAACSLLPDAIRGRQVHGLLVKNGCGSESILKTALMDTYSRCGLLPESVLAFQEIVAKDVVAWNTLLSSFIRHGLPGDALKFYREMQRSGVDLSAFTLCSLLKACCLLRNLRLGTQVHALVIVMGAITVITSTALVDFYSNCGLMANAVQVFFKLGCQKDEAIYNSLLSGCVHNREYEMAFGFARRIKPNRIALTTILAACSELSDLQRGKQVHCVVIRRGFEADTILFNALLDMYAKSGKIAAARFVFEQMGEKDVSSWTSIVDACGRHGYGTEALKLLKKMEYVSNGVSPNSVTYLAVLSACAHSGLVGGAKECFVSMRERHRIEPDSEHYACFIDLLGRAGQVQEAWDLYDDMKRNNIEPTAAVWAALLNACKTNLDTARAELAAKNLFKLEPENPANYVLLSNFYAAVGKWEGAQELRRVMLEKGLRKEKAGCSFFAD